MTRLIRSICLAAAALAFGVSMANAQSHDNRYRDDRSSQAQRHQGGPSHHAQRPHRPDYRPDHRPSYRPDHRPGYRPDYRPGYRPDYRPGYRPVYRPDYGPTPLPYYQGRRGVGPNHNWHRGSRMPPSYRTRHYVVNDWRGHRLSAPPRDHYWVQNGADYLLVAIATGVIAQIILSR